MANFPLSDRGPFGTFKLPDRVVASKNSFVSIVYWHYSKQNFGAPTNIYANNSTVPNDLDGLAFDVSRGVIEEEVSSLRISKNIDEPTGTFEFTLFPTQNWKQILSPGDWVALYIFDTYEFKNQTRTPKNLMMLGNIDRVARSLAKDQDSDKVQLRYVISGRNFGKVFEETDVWFDPYSVQEKTLDTALRTAGLPLSGTPSQIVQSAVDVFLGPGLHQTEAVTSALQQWRIPFDLVQMFGNAGNLNFTDGTDRFAVDENNPVFYDILRQNIAQSLPGFKQNQMITPDDNGSLWETLKRGSNGLVNEIFLEEIRNSDGEAFPTIVLRPRPLNSVFLLQDQFNNPFGDVPGIKDFLQFSSKTLQQLAKENFLEISFAEIKYEDIGKDDHSRFNMFWLTTSLKTDYVLTPAANLDVLLGLSNPTFQRQSIKRHGLRRLQQNLEFCYVENGDTNDAVKGPNVNWNLYKAFMAQVYDMHAYNHLYESGTIECTGVIEAELGKALIIKQQNNKDLSKVFYIEGYEHEWHFPNTWITRFTVSHGQFLTNSKDIFIDALGGQGTTYTDNGQADNTMDTVYIAKTHTDKK